MFEFASPNGLKKYLRKTFQGHQEKNQKFTCLSDVYEQVRNEPQSPLYPYGERIGKRVERVKVTMVGSINRGRTEFAFCKCGDGCGTVCFMPFEEFPVTGDNGIVIGFKKMQIGKTYAIPNRLPFLDGKGTLEMVF